MSEKQNKSSQVLSSKEKELIEYYKKRQHVLLYGQDNIGRRELIRNVHKANNGEDAEEIYFDDKGKRTSLSTSAKEFIGISVEGHSSSTENTWKHIDCGAMNAKEVYITLVIDSGIIDRIKEGDIHLEKDLLKKYMEEDICMINEQELRNLDHRFESGYNGYLCYRKGLLFADNLHCDKNSREDNDCYRKLAKIINDDDGIYRGVVEAIEGGKVNLPFSELRKIAAFDSLVIYADWLVIYAYNPHDFPQYFLDQLKLVSLDMHELKKGKVKETETNKITQSKTQRKLTDKIPSGTKWTDIEITFIDNDHVNIKVKNKKGEDIIKSGVHYSQMGFKHETSPKKIKLWDTLVYRK